MPKKGSLGEGPNSNTGGGTAPSGPIDINVEALCDKIEAQTETICEKTEAQTETLCEKLETQTETLCEKTEAQTETLCEKLEAQTECLEDLKERKENVDAVVVWGWREDYNTVDNHSIGEPRPDGPGIVAWPQDDHEVTLTLSDGSECVVDWPSVPLDAQRWRASNEALAAAIAECTGKAWEFDVSAPDANPNTAWGGHASSICCPGDVYVVAAVAVVVSEARNGRIIPLATSYTQGELFKYKQFICQGEADVWTDFNGEVVEVPDLSCAAIDCAFPDSGPACCPVPVQCATETFPGCLIQLPEDEETGEPVVAQTNVFQRFEFCEGNTTIINFSVDAEGEEVPVEVAADQYIGDCDTLEPFNPAPVCPDNCVWELMQYQVNHAVWDNTNYIDPETGAVRAGDVLEFEFNDGTTSQLTIVKNSLSDTKAYFESLGCKAKVHCDNWVINGEDRCLKFPNWPTGKTICGDLTIDDAYAAYLIISHCDAAKLPVKTTIVATGATHHSVQCSTSEKVKACVLCDNVLVKTLDGEALDADPTCLTACKTEVCDTALTDLIESMKVTKSNGIDDANYEGAFRYINGRPPASSAWALIDNRDPLNQVTIASGANLNEFTADLESKGFTEWNSGEEHWVCPCPPGLTFESTGAYFTTVDGETATKLVCTPLAEVPDVPVAKISAQVVCAMRTEGCLDQDILDALDCIAATKENCCIVPEGALTERARCQSFNRPDPFGDGEEGTTHSIRIEGVYVDLPNPHTHADVLDALNGQCGTWQIVTNDDGTSVLCNTEVDACGAVAFRTCTTKGTFPVVSLACGLSTSIATVVEPTEPACRDYLRVWSKYEEPTADNIQNIDGNIAELLAKQCAANEAANEIAEVQLAKLCLIDAGISGPCPAPVAGPGLDKAANTLTLEGDVVANYPEGQAINLQNANGDACGSATSTGEATYNAETDVTTIVIEECELDEGKTAAAIVKAVAVTATVKTAITTVKAFAVKRAVTVKEPVKETTTKG